MPGSAKRFGLDVKGDLELEIRLRRIEQALELKQDANVDATDVSRARIPVPQVTGLSLTGKTPGSVSVGWNAVAIPDLRRYELQFATNLGFTENLQTKNLASTAFTFDTASVVGGGGGATFFARVRARNVSGQVGLYSVTLNTSTGQAQTSDIADEAVTIPKIDDESAGSLTVAEVQTLIDDATAGLIGASSVPDYINELTMSVNGGDAKTLDIAVGVASDSTNTLIMSNSSTFVKDLEVAWAEGTAQGGLGDGLTLTADVWYHVFMIAKTDGTVDFGADTSVTAFNLLVSATDYTLFRRIGSVKTNTGDTDIRVFQQNGDRFTWDTPEIDYVDIGVLDSTVISLIGAPPDVKTWVTMNALLSGVGAGGDIAVFLSDGMDLTLTASTTGVVLGQFAGTGATNSRAAGQVTVLTSGGDPPQITLDTTDSTNVDMEMTVVIYEDFRGQNGQ